MESAPPVRPPLRRWIRSKSCGFGAGGDVRPRFLPQGSFGWASCRRDAGGRDRAWLGMRDHPDDTPGARGGSVPRMAMAGPDSRARQIHRAPPRRGGGACRRPPAIAGGPRVLARRERLHGRLQRISEAGGDVAHWCEASRLPLGLCAGRSATLRTAWIPAGTAPGNPRSEGCADPTARVRSRPNTKDRWKPAMDSG